jgi:hypothetical protein
MRLLAAEGLPTLSVIVGDGPPVTLPIRSGTIGPEIDSAIDPDIYPVEAEATDLLLAVFGRTVPRDPRLAAVLAELPQL